MLVTNALEVATPQLELPCQDSVGGDMAFVIEKITADVDIAKYNSLDMTSPFTGRRVPPWKWVIDRSRDVFLVPLGGDGSEGSERPATFVLVYQGRRVYVEGFVRYGDAAVVSDDVSWTMSKVVLPAVLAEEADMIFQLIREAISEYGLLGNKAGIRSTSVVVPESAVLRV